MTISKQVKAAKRNIKKARKIWKEMTPRQRSLAQPKGRKRQKPGTTGKGDYYHIVVRPKEGFVTFRTQDVGRKGHAQRVAGKRRTGSWDTLKWLISKDDAEIKNGYLIAKNKTTEKILKTLGSKAKWLKGDRFSAKPRPNVPEKKKPTPAQKKARTKNIKKAQQARMRYNQIR